jgi:3-hydroxymyristoyl/3-hydroxydecanoyl-(acyl carrier protein) dehydratase
MKFRMVDRILGWEPRRWIRGVKTVSFEEYQLRQRLGDEACLPESLVLESLFQLGNWLMILSSDYARMGVVVQFDEARFLNRLRPGCRLLMEVNVHRWREDGMILDGQADDGRQSIVTGRRCLAVPVALEDYYDPEDLRVLFSEIYRPEEPASREDSTCPG